MGGPSPNTACIFPFVHEGKSYFGCPIDPDDSSKRWCSTQVDSNGNHVIGGGHYGECGSSCPVHSDGSFIPGPTNPVSSTCSGNQACRPFTSCSSQVIGCAKISKYLAGGYIKHRDLDPYSQNNLCKFLNLYVTDKPICCITRQVHYFGGWAEDAKSLLC